ncbi:hydrogenase maturation protease [Cellulomonas denverensis]|nr:hydrogenase maturation protease [Cellulomonas denverensis]GIG25060.1 hydrogenase 2 maturation endopeptidase [Cellulomonas denverensis]
MTADDLTAGPGLVLPGGRRRPGTAVDEREPGPAPVTVLGIGNPIMTDDGTGLELLAAVSAARPDPRVRYLDGGTGGMELVPVVQEAERLLLLDAVAGPRPGVAVRLSGDHLPRLLAGTLSPHQVGLLDVLSAARLLGRTPATIEVVGIVPASVELGLGLTPQVRAAVPAAVRASVSVLDEWLAELPAAVGQP